MTVSRIRSGDTPVLESVSAVSYVVPAERPETDGTFAWSSTTWVCVTATAGGHTGLGWTYGPAACGLLVEELLGPALVGLPAFAIVESNEIMSTAVRNTGRAGVAALAISAVDVALWDLKARLLGVSLAALLGGAEQGVPIYGSGGFTSYDQPTLESQLRGWSEAGIGRAKIKIGERRGTNPDRDLDRIRSAREVIGGSGELYADADGGYTRKQAVRVGRVLEAYDVRWFEEPVSSDDKAGLAQVRDALDVDVAAGQYAYDLGEVRRLCGVVDCLQLDISRCGGITGWQAATAVASSYGLEVSGHCAPYLHLAAASATANLRHLEWFHDHVRLEQRFLDGPVPPRHGMLAPGLGGLGHGYELKTADLDPFRVR